jgi:hypothetical protein
MGTSRLALAGIFRARTWFLALATLFVTCRLASAAPPPKPDLADVAAGTYAGDVISDARGSSQSGVTITVTKVGPNMVEVSSDYPRLPTFRVRLTRAMNTIQKAGPGNEVFLLDLSKRPPGLDVTVDDASWSGGKR